MVRMVHALVYTIGYLVAAVFQSKQSALDESSPAFGSGL